MPSRTMTRLAAAGALAAALTAVGAPPAAAQQPNPWRGEAARLPVAPMPRPVDEVIIDNLTFRYSGPITGDVVLGRFWAVAVPEPAPMPRAVAARCDCTAVPAVAPMPRAATRCCEGACCQNAPVACEQVVIVAAPGGSARISGTWYREAAGAVAAFTFTPDELRVTVAIREGGATATLTLTADYAVTRDGTVHGVITGADVEVIGDQDALPEAVGFGVAAQGMVDQPFAIRCRPTDGGLMVSNVRFTGPQACPAEMQLMAGKYRPARDVSALPAPKPTRSVIPGFGDAVAVPYDVGVLPPPPPPGVGEMMLDAFGRMIGGVRGEVHGGMTLPGPTYLQHPPQHFPADPAFPLPRELPGPVPAMLCPTGPCPAPIVVPTSSTGPLMPGLPASPRAPAPTSGIVGEWNRTAPGAMIGLTASPTRLTLRALGTDEDEPVLLVLTADYKELRDGCLVGVITAADVEPLPGSNPVLPRGAAGKELRAMVDQPISCRFLVQDGELILIDLKCGGRDHLLDGEEAALLTGRYAKGEPKWPGKARGRKQGASGGGIGTPPNHLTPDRIHGGIK
jgi:hypothetical protein